MEIIKDWPEKKLTCAFCGETRSVKYVASVKDVNGKEQKLPCCNGCIGKHV